MLCFLRNLDRRGLQVPLLGATVPLAVGRQASDLDRPVPSMSRGISAAHHRRWAAYAMSLVGLKAYILGSLLSSLLRGVGFMNQGFIVTNKIGVLGSDVG